VESTIAMNAECMEAAIRCRVGQMTRLTHNHADA
jgi:hypothetical protein